MREIRLEIWSWCRISHILNWAMNICKIYMNMQGEANLYDNLYDNYLDLSTWLWLKKV